MDGGIICTPDGSMMLHPGLPSVWIGAALVGMALALGWVTVLGVGPGRGNARLALSGMPLIGGLVARLTRSVWPLRLLKLAFVAAFVLIVYAGLAGTQVPRQNAATMLVWNIWWAGLVFSVLFLGSAWCAVCPWDTLANLLVRHRLTGRASPLTSLGLRVPKSIRNVWPALLMFVGLSWLELGVGVTASPYETALLALLMVILAVASAAIFERKAFCRFFCPVGRTVGFYSQLAPVELRPRDRDICASCTSLACYHGSDRVDPCPTYQVMGTMKQNTFCTSCGNCARSCPAANVTWRLRSPAAEAAIDARPHWDEAMFMVGLLSLTTFHGVTMLEFWDKTVLSLAAWTGSQSGVILAFTALFILAIAAEAALFAGSIWLSGRLAGTGEAFRATFSRFAFVALPLAFAYHLSHNLNHLVREGSGLLGVLADPLGQTPGAELTMEQRMQAMSGVLPPNAIWAIQAIVMAAGFAIAVWIIANRGRARGEGERRALSVSQLPLLAFAGAITVFHLWILSQPMLMRF